MNSLPSAEFLWVAQDQHADNKQDGQEECHQRKQANAGNSNMPDNHMPTNQSTESSLDWAKNRSQGQEVAPGPRRNSGRRNPQ